jgi:hypothetical protein
VLLFNFTYYVYFWSMRIFSPSMSNCLFDTHMLLPEAARSRKRHYIYTGARVLSSSNQPAKVHIEGKTDLWTQQTRYNLFISL